MSAMEYYRNLTREMRAAGAIPRPSSRNARARVHHPRPGPKLVPLPVLRAPCPKQGALVAECSSCGGPNEARRTYWCDHPDNEDGRCTRGNPQSGLWTCSTCDYHPDAPKPAPAPPRDPWASPVLVPQPPAYTGQVTSPRAVVTVVTGESGRAMWEVSGPLMRAYAERLGADLVVLNWTGHPDWPMSAKFALGPVLEHYERVIYADADVLFRSGCLDLFQACAPDELGGYSDLAEVMRWNTEFAGEYQRVCKFLTGEPTALPFYLNTGVLVLSRDHRPLFSTPAVPIPPLHCSEQHWWVRNIITSGTRVKLLPRACNWQFWVDKWREPIPPEAVIHVSGWAGTLAARVAEMRRLAAL